MMAEQGFWHCACRLSIYTCPYSCTYTFLLLIKHSIMLEQTGRSEEVGIILVDSE